MNAPRWAATAALGAALLLGGHGLAQTPVVPLPAPAASGARPADALRQGLRGALNAAAAPLLQQAASAVPVPPAVTQGGGKPVEALKAAATAAAASAANSALTRASAAPSPPAPPAPSPTAVPAAKPAAPAARAEAFPVPEPAPSRATPLPPDPTAGTALQLNYTTVMLPPAREGETYGPRSLVVGGGLGLTADIASPGLLPPGLNLQPNGQLGGRPEPGSARTWRFTLEVRDGTGQLLRQAYALNVLPPRVTPSPRVVTRALKSYRAAEVEPGPRNGSITIYMLKADALDAVLQSWADTSLTPGVRHAELADLENMYVPLVGVEFPTLALFDAALRDRQCALWLLKHAKAVSDRTAPARPAAADCSDVAAEPARPAPPGMQSLKALYDSYLPEELQRQLRDAAREIRWLDPREAPPGTEPAPDAASAAKPAGGKAAAVAPQRLVSTACGCVRWPTEDDVVGLLPFWQDTNEGVELARLQRLQMFAAVLQDDGSLAWPAAWTTPAGLDELALEARRHDVRVDLVVHRQVWRALLDSPNPEPFIRRTVDTLMQVLERPAPRAWPRGLMPVWGQAERLFDGLVLWFEPEEGASDEAFQRVYRQVVMRLHQAMLAAKRPLQLTLVVPDGQFGTAGTPFAMSDLVAYVEGEFKDDGKTLAPKAADDRPAHFEPREREHLRVRLLVLLQEPTTVTKKNLRGAIDRTSDVRGARRVFLIEHIDALARLPFPPRAGEPSAGSQFDDDIAYHQWVFQGVGLWPLPQGESGDRVMQRVAEHFKATTHWSEFPVVCNFVCPHRNGLHLLMETLLVLCGLALAVWRLTDWAQNRGWWARLVLLLPPIASIMLAYALLSCDPGLRELRQGWMLPALFFVVGLPVALWAALARRITPP